MKYILFKFFRISCYHILVYWLRTFYLSQIRSIYGRWFKLKGALLCFDQKFNPWLIKFQNLTVFKHYLNFRKCKFKNQWINSFLLFLASDKNLVKSLFRKLNFEIFCYFCYIPSARTSSITTLCSVNWKVLPIKCE